MTPPITEAQLLALHARSLEVHGGAAGVKDDPSRCIDAAMNACLYELEGYDPLFFAWRLFRCLAKGHNFVDGNKRVSWAAMLLVLECEGLSLEATDDEAERFVIDVAASNRSERDAIDWIEARLYAKA